MRPSKCQKRPAPLCSCFPGFCLFEKFRCFFFQRNQSTSLLLFSSFFFKDNFQIIFLFFQKNSCCFSTQPEHLSADLFFKVRIQTYAHAFVRVWHARKHTNTASGHRTQPEKTGPKMNILGFCFIFHRTQPRVLRRRDVCVDETSSSVMYNYAGGNCTLHYY